MVYLTILDWQVPSCLEGCNFLTVALSTPANSLAHSFFVVTMGACLNPLPLGIRR